MTVCMYDTTLRDGTQRYGMGLSLKDKLILAQKLDDFGVPFIEGGWPGSNPKDRAFFTEAAKIKWKNSQIAAFGSTRKAGVEAADDANLQALLAANTPVVTLVGKSSRLHVEKVLCTDVDENLAMIYDSVRFCKDHDKTVVFDAEHFFDGFKENAAYALECLLKAEEAGADWLVLCDTNGGSLPHEISSIVRHVAKMCTTSLGIHTHNDGELAVANSLAGVHEGCSMVQATLNGYGERCGNANLISVIANLQLKMGYSCVEQDKLTQLTALSHYASELANLNHDAHLPYTGSAAFAHKGGIHVAAVEKLPASYEHIPPEQVGNLRKIVISELSGRGNVRLQAEALGLDLKENPFDVLQVIKEKERLGYQFDEAEGSFEMLVRRRSDEYHALFEVLDLKVLSERRNKVLNFAEASVKLQCGESIMHTVADGEGPVEALDKAFRKALEPLYPELKKVRLSDYKVRIIDPREATSAITRVTIEATDGNDSWITVGCSPNIIQASSEALVDSLELFLIRMNQQNLKGEQNNERCQNPV